MIKANFREPGRGESVTTNYYLFNSSPFTKLFEDYIIYI